MASSEPDFSAASVASALLTAAGNDWAFIDEISGLFIEESPSYVAAIRVAIERGDATHLQEAAHSLKGATANLYAGATFAAAHRMEEIGRAGKMEEAEEALAVLDVEVGRLEAALTALREETATRFRDA